MSAALDGEPTGTTTTALDDHRSGCEDCRAWEHDVAVLTRRARVREAETAPPGLADAVLARTVLPAVRGRRRVTVLRWAVGVVGVVQVGLAVPALFHDDLGMAMSEHASHESAAWNLAVAAALLLVAARPRRVGGALTAVGTFVAVLLGLSLLDVVAGRVGAERLLTHTAVVVGAGLLVALRHTLRSAPDDVPVDPAVADPGAVDDAHALRDWAGRASRSPRGRRRDVA